MIREDLEMGGYDEGSEHTDPPYNSQALLLGGTIIDLCVVQGPGSAAYNPFATVLGLSQYSA